MNQFQLNESTGKYCVRGQVSAKAIIEQATRFLAKRLTRSGSKTFTSPDAARQFVQLQLADRERESFACLFLDNRHRLIAYEELFHGTIDGASVHPREVVKSALRYNAAAVVLAHNHPSGVAEASTGSLAGRIRVFAEHSGSRETASRRRTFQSIRGLLQGLS